MLMSIFEWLAQYIAEFLELIVQLFMDALDFDLSTYIETFPLLESAYSTFQTLALGILVLVAGSGLIQFALNPTNDREWTDRPVTILFKRHHHGFKGRLDRMRFRECRTERSGIV